MLAATAFSTCTVAETPATDLYKNRKVVRRYAKDYKVALEDAERHFEELQRFLWICANSPEPCAPSHKLDVVWHTFIMFTRDYQIFCHEFLGKFVHHNPTDGPETECYQKTRMKAEELFGDLDPKMWPKRKEHAADCDSSCSGDTYCSDASCNSD